MPRTAADTAPLNIKCPTAILAELDTLASEGEFPSTRTAVTIQLLREALAARRKA